MLFSSIWWHKWVIIVTAEDCCTASVVPNSSRRDVQRHWISLSSGWEWDLASNFTDMRNKQLSLTMMTDSSLDTPWKPMFCSKPGYVDSLCHFEKCCMQWFWIYSLLHILIFLFCCPALSYAERLRIIRQKKKNKTKQKNNHLVAWLVAKCTQPTASSHEDYLFCVASPIVSAGCQSCN